MFGTTAPPRGLSGSLRRLAFQASENDVRRWTLLLLADRIDVVEGVLEDLMQDHIPTVLAEMGVASERGHNRPVLLRKLALMAAVAELIARSLRHRREERAELSDLADESGTALGKQPAPWSRRLTVTLLP